MRQNHLSPTETDGNLLAADSGFQVLITEKTGLRREVAVILLSAGYSSRQPGIKVVGAWSSQIEPGSQVELHV